MKIKRFDNLWSMGLILCGIFLVLFYVAKIFFPEFIIGIAETPRIVELGVAIQSNKWYLHIFNFIIGFFYGYVFCCACCRTNKLNWKGNLILVGELLLLRLINEFYPLQYSTLNLVGMVIVPFLVGLVNNTLSKETFISTMACFGIEFAFEFLSLVVRDLTTITTQLNIVSVLVLLIDGLIWRILLYLFFNYKNKNKEKE